MARAEGSVALQQLAGVSGFWPGCPLVRELGVPLAMCCCWVLANGTMHAIKCCCMRQRDQAQRNPRSAKFACTRGC